MNNLHQHSDSEKFSSKALAVIKTGMHHGEPQPRNTATGKGAGSPIDSSSLPPRALMTASLYIWIPQRLENLILKFKSPH